MLERIFSKGFIHRHGQRVKELGERMARLRALRALCGPVIRHGARIKDSVSGSPVGEMTAKTFRRAR